MLTIATTDALRAAIQNRLIELGRLGPFYRIRYGDGLALDLDTETTNNFPPRSCIANETQSEFEPDTLNGRKVAQAQTVWNFDLKLSFDAEVSFEAFKKILISDVPRVRVEGQPIAFLRLSGIEVSHPVQQNAATGTEANFSFSVSTGRL